MVTHDTNVTTWEAAAERARAVLRNQFEAGPGDTVKPCLKEK